MKKLLAIAAILFLSQSPTLYAAEETYKFDPNHTEVVFSYRHLGMSRSYVQFNKIGGEVKMDKSAPEKSSVNVTIDAASVNTGLDVFDQHLKDKNFFDVAKYPDITFKSTKVEKTGSKTYKIMGNLTIKGKTRPVTLDMTHIVDQAHPLGAFNPKYKDVYVAAFSAKTTIKRSEFGMGQYAPATSDEVEIIIETEMFRQ